jgi:GTP cyclohydrolase I
MNHLESEAKEESINDEDLYYINDEEKQKKIQLYINKIIHLVDPDAKREGMKKTPKRYSEALMEMTKGYSINMDKIINNAIFDSNGFNDIILVKNMKYNSLCEHHLLPFFGEVAIGYIPKDKILGLSKFPRIVDAISKKFTLQEKFTMDIANFIQKTLNPEGVIVVANGVHSCMCFRGIKAIDSKTNTVYTVGQFKNTDKLNAFFKLLEI